MTRRENAGLADDGRGPAEVVVLAQADCGLCDQAKKALARVATDFELRISEVDLVSSEGQELARNSGVMFPPGILLDGRLFSYGRLSERKLRRELVRRELGRRDGRG